MDRCKSSLPAIALSSGGDLVLPASGRFWLKWVRLAGRSSCGVADIGEPVDLRVEGGVIRAILPAGEAPCCAPGLNLYGGHLAPITGGDCFGIGAPASFLVTWGDGVSKVMNRGCWATPEIL